MNRLPTMESETAGRRQPMHVARVVKLTRRPVGQFHQRCSVGFLVGFGGREPVAEGDDDSVDGRLSRSGPPGFPVTGGVQGAGDQVQAR